jgi:exoribonuclease-2
MSHNHFDLAAAARQEMLDRGFEPDFSPQVQEQLTQIEEAPETGLRDLTSLAWSSIDNDDSRDLDQIEWAERAREGFRVLVGVADVDSKVAPATPIDAHARAATTTVYTGIRTFPMLPERLSTDVTSLNESQNRAAVVVDMQIAADGTLGASSIYRALVSNRAQLTYNAVGAWLEGAGPMPPKLAASADLAAQLKLQDEAAGALRDARHRLGALVFDRLEPEPVIRNGKVEDIAARCANRASHLIEDFMIAANEAMARYLRAAGVSSIRRVVRAPERWARIVELASQYHSKLPAEPDSGALNQFLASRKQADPVHYPDLSLTVLKLMGSGEYVLMRKGDEAPGHFGLAAHDYTHSTAPNRRFADLVMQRLVKSQLGGHTPPYSDDELAAIARDCTFKEDAARKVNRDMQKRIAAVALQSRIGQIFSAVVTGVTPKGVFVRILQPPAEGRLMRGEAGLAVGDQLRVSLLSTDPVRAFIDFARK